MPTESARKPASIINCRQCGASFRIKPSHIGRVFCCSWKCGRASVRKRSGIEHNGHWYALSATGYYIDSQTRLRLHRVIWEEANGKIPDGYDVHHIDGDRLNNSPSNLCIESHAEHAKRHMVERKRDANGRVMREAGAWPHWRDLRLR